MLELEVRRPGSLLSVELRQEITEEQLAAIRTLLDNDRDVVAVDIPQLTGKECGDIAITAAEGGIGHWSRIVDYDWHRWAGPEDFIGHGHRDNSTAPDDPGFVFYTIEFENPDSDDPPRKTETITPALLRRGFETMARADKNRGGWPVPKLLAMSREDWTGEIDAEIADMLVQFGVFGKVVFG